MRACIMRPYASRVHGMSFFLSPSLASRAAEGSADACDAHAHTRGVGIYTLSIFRWPFLPCGGGRHGGEGREEGWLGAHRAFEGGKARMPQEAHKGAREARKMCGWMKSRPGPWRGPKGP